MESDHRALDALKGVGAIAIAVAAWSAYVSPGAIGDFAPRLGLFIDLFFVASGFILAAVCRDAIRRPGDLATFLLLRLARLYPTHLFFLIPLAILSLADPGAGGPMQVLFEEVTLTRIFTPEGGGGWSMVGWYVAAEFWSALIFGFACLAGLMRTANGRAALALATLFAAVWASGAGSGAESGGVGALARGVFGFGAGVAAQSVLRWGRARALLVRSGGWAEGGALLTLVFFLVAAPDAWLFAAPAPFALVAAVFAAGRGPARRCLSAAPFRLLGAGAYPIFMGHFTLLVPFIALNAVLDGAAPEAVSHLIGVYITACVIMAAITHRLIETPTRAAIHAWLAGQGWARPALRRAAFA